MAEGKRVLVYRIGSLGDTIMVLPGFHKVLETYPGADITLLTNRPPVNKAAPIQSVLGDAGYFFHRVVNYPTGIRNPLVLLRLIKQLRSLKIDTVVNLATTRIIGNSFRKTKLGVLRDKLFFRAAGIKNLVGFPRVYEDYMLSLVPGTDHLEWETNRMARMLSDLGPIDLDNNKYWDLNFIAEESAEADKMLSGLDASRPFIAASTGTKRQTNDWEESNWLNLMARLKPLLPNYQLVMFGTADEAGRADKCLAAWGNDGINLCGKTSPRVSGATMQKARIFIGHDSGPMHLSAAGGTPCVAIYASRNLPGQWYPRGKFNKLIYHRVDCQGCLLEVCIEQKKKCILSITVDEVINATLELLAETGVKDNVNAN